ncbi:MAG: tyrosine-type recombinase/integrase [Eubacterium sp.]|nr:tyrosine-type recombinase/integrase [Eubacterium sp.]
MRKEEKAEATAKKYLRDVRELWAYLKGEPPTKENLIAYREWLMHKNQVQTVNGKLSAINHFLDYLGLKNLRLKLFRIQRKAFREEKRMLTEAEYRRLLDTARLKNNERLYHIMLTIAGTGIRVSELSFITVEAVKKGQAEIHLKGKDRIILLPKALRKRLRDYAKKMRIEAGYIFKTRNGNPLDRSNICHDMKKLCAAAAVASDKVFPHNFRHLFARTFFAIEKNIAHLADILGHSSVETTRIYLAASAGEYQKILGKMRLII